MGARGQTKRIQQRIWKHMVEVGKPMTSPDIYHWYMDEFDRNNPSRKYARGANHGLLSINSLANIMKSSILFEKVGRTKGAFNGKQGHIIFEARPIDVVIEKALASRKPIHKFPMFLEKELRRIEDADN